MLNAVTGGNFYPLSHLAHIELPLRRGGGFFEVEMSKLTCTRCNMCLDVLEFHKNNNSKRGYQWQCKACVHLHYEKNKESVIKRSNEWRENNPVRCREIKRKHANKKEVKEKYKKYRRDNREQTRKTTRRYALRNRKKRLAGAAVILAIKKGLLIKKPCGICGKKKSQAHHDSYKKENWLNVIWFCHKHHRARHVELKDMGVTL